MTVYVTRTQNINDTNIKHITNFAEVLVNRLYLNLKVIDFATVIRIESFESMLNIIITSICEHSKTIHFVKDKHQNCLFVELNESLKEINQNYLIPCMNLAMYISFCLYQGRRIFYKNWVSKYEKLPKNENLNLIHDMNKFLKSLNNIQ